METENIKALKEDNWVSLALGPYGRVPGTTGAPGQ